MKKLKKLIVLFTAALFCILPILSQPLTAQASEPTTYYLKYINNEWRFLKNITVWDETGFHRELYYMHQDIKDGDTIIIDSPANIDLTVYVKLKNLTVLNSTLAVVHATSYDEVFVANGSSAAINGDVTNGTVFNGGSVNFNNNIQNLRVEGVSSVNVLGNAGNILIYDPNDPEANISCSGTVDYVKAYDDDYLYYEAYTFAADTFRTTRGNLLTEAKNYSTTAPTAAPSVTSSTTPAAPSAPADDLDEVPKTGDFSVSPLWFLALAAVCMFGYVKLERR